MAESSFKTVGELVAWYQSQYVDEDLSVYGRAHNWRNYIPESLRGIWAVLPIETRAALYVVAEAAASGEEWD